MQIQIHMWILCLLNFVFNKEHYNKLLFQQIIDNALIYLKQITDNTLIYLKAYNDDAYLVLYM
jgi:hypothetical protein